MEYLSALAGLGIPSSVVRSLVARGVDAFVLIQQDPDGARRIWRITEVMGLDELGEVVLQDTFRYVNEGWTPDGQLAGHFTRLPTPGRMDERFRLAGLGG
jgi:pilus assembly protein CpaF